MLIITLHKFQMHHLHNDFERQTASPLQDQNSLLQQWEDVLILRQRAYPRVIPTMPVGPQVAYGYPGPVEPEEPPPNLAGPNFNWIGKLQELYQRKLKRNLEKQESQMACARLTLRRAFWWMSLPHEMVMAKEMVGRPQQVSFLSGIRWKILLKIMKNTFEAASKPRFIQWSGLCCMSHADGLGPHQSFDQLQGAPSILSYDTIGISI